MRMVAILLAILATPAIEAQAGNLSPVTISQFSILQDAAAKDGAWASVALDNYMIGLFEGAILVNERKFCLPPSFETGSVADVFGRLRAELDASIREATPDQLVATLFLNHLFQMYPC